MLGRFSITNKLVAKDLGKSEEQVNRVMAFYVKALEKEMVECNHPFIFVKGLGTFGLNLKVMESRLKFMISKYRGHIKHREVREYKSREKTIETYRREITFLFRARKLVKVRRKENQQIRCSKNLE